mmetsp:Transcript_66443/g.210283  ORF Transcript_66443/g.210283 Transcript_66443/m.210283 type:complete len:753 (-) Transcript_66443:1638-3896(-)
MITTNPLQPGERVPGTVGLPAGVKLAVRMAAESPGSAAVRDVTALPPAPATWGTNEVVWPPGALLPVHGMVRRGAARAGSGALAIAQAGAGGTTFGALLGAAEAAARRLAALGVGRGKTVAMLLPRSPDAAAIWLGVLIAGGAYAPLPLSAPPPVVRAMLECAAPVVVVAGADIARDAGGAWAAARVVSPEELLAAGAEWGGEAGGRSEAGLEDPAMVLFTSGSTGVPKGVIIPHRAVSNHMLFLAKDFPLERGEGVLACIHFQYVGHIQDLFYPWSVGAHAILATDDEVADPARLALLARSQRCSSVNAVPTVLRLIVDAALMQPEATAESLRTVFVTGESLPRRLVEDFHRAWPGAELVNMWGCTEALGSTYCRISRGDPGLISIGTPTANVRVSIVDAGGAPVPVDCVGELVVSGANVALGYIGRPDLTAAKFSRSDGGDARYLTGDRARWLPTGEVFLEGRADMQVKIRGQAVLLEEVDRQLLSLPGVEAAAAAAAPGAEAEGTVLVALVTPASLDVSALAAALRRCAVAVVVPSVLLAVDALPRLPTSGKVDRAAVKSMVDEMLQARSAAGAVASAASTEGPRSAVSRARAEMEEKVLEIYRDVMGLRNLSLMDDIFTRGGHSLNVISARARLAELAPTANISIDDIYTHRTAEGLAAAMMGGSEGVDRGGAAAGLGASGADGSSTGVASGVLRSRNATAAGSQDLEQGVGAVEVSSTAPEGELLVLRNCMCLWTLVRGGRAINMTP